MRYLFLKEIAILIFLAILIQLPAERASAQMFSVTDRGVQERMQYSYTSLLAGWEFAEFTFRGDPDAIDEAPMDFNDGIFKLYFENPGIDVYLGFGGNLTGMSNNNYLNVGAILYNNFVLNSSDRFWVLLPVQVNTDLKMVQADESPSQFRQSGFLVGAGLGVRSKLSDHSNMLIQSIPAYGFSTSQGAFFGGTVFSFKGSVRFYFESLIGNRALVLGYNYQYRRYQIDPELFNYNYGGHTITAGITF